MIRMRSHRVILLFAFLGILLANQLNQVNAKPDQEAQYDEDTLPQEDQEDGKQESPLQEDKDNQYDVATALKTLQEIQNAPEGQKLQSLYWYRRRFFRRIIRSFYPYRWRRYYRCFGYYY
ncbi:hypothetical protein UPYG_G00328260 [Umbra pygmaea]|uniref:Uncharacterized protein n=1 Tax=Umbra pygmaea TaxID=75934 RepID=A0ABD0W1L5_UMBPY